MDLSSTRTRWLLAAATAVVAAIATVGLILFRSDSSSQEGIEAADDPDRGARPTEPDDPGDTTSDEAPDKPDEPDDEAPSTPSDPAPPIGEPFIRQVIWPRPSSDVRFDDPKAAARSFALYYARFDDPVIEEFQAADSHSGEVPVRTRPGGPVTVVRVAVTANEQWFVTGAGTDDITVEQPEPTSTLSCPMATRGTALAFEGTVQVRIDAYQPDGARVELGRGFVTGSGSPPAGPFSERIRCRSATGVEDVGVVAFWTDDASGDLDGPLQFVAIPVRLP